MNECNNILNATNYIEQIELIDSKDINIELNKTDILIKKEKVIKRTKDEIYKKEQTIILDKIFKILNINENNLYFDQLTVDAKSEEILSLSNDIKVYYHSKVWTRPTTETPNAIFLVKNILSFHGFIITFKRISLTENGNNIKTIKYFMIKNNDLLNKNNNLLNNDLLNKNNDLLNKNNDLLNKKTKSKKNKYAYEQKKILDIFFKLLEIDIDNNKTSFDYTIVEQKNNDFLSHIEDIKKYFGSKTWLRPRKDGSAISIIKGMLAEYNYLLSSKIYTINDNGIQKKHNKYFINKIV